MLDLVDVPPDPPVAAGVDRDPLVGMQQVRDEFIRFTMQYKFAIDEVMTKVWILREESVQTHAYNRIEHVSSRLKSPESLVDKILRKAATRPSRAFAPVSPTLRGSASPAASSATPTACSTC